MNPFEMPTNSAASDWLMFVAILLAVGLGIACFVVWFFMFRKELSASLFRYFKLCSSNLALQN